MSKPSTITAIRLQQGKPKGELTLTIKMTGRRGAEAICRELAAVAGLESYTDVKATTMIKIKV